MVSIRLVVFPPGLFRPVVFSSGVISSFNLEHSGFYNVFICYCVLEDSSAVIILGEYICHFRGVGSNSSLYSFFDGTPVSKQCIL